jgi:adenylate cyclase
MAEAKVAAVMVDVLQFDRGKGPEELVNASADKLEATKARVKETPPLMDAYKALRDGGAIVLGMELLSARDEQMNANAAAVRMPVYEEMAKRLPPLDVVPEFSRERIWLPVVRLLSSASQVGFVNSAPDDDGVLRRVVPLGRLGTRTVPSLSMATALSLRLETTVRGRSIRLGDAEQRLDERGAFIANFRKVGGAYAAVRPADMVAAGYQWDEAGRKGDIPEVGTAKVEAVRGKIVVWGVNAPGVKDIVSAPVSDRFAGPEFQATVLDNLLNGDGRVAADSSTNTVILFALAALLGLIGGFTLPRGVLFGVWLLLSGGLVFAAYRWFREGTSIDLVTPLIALGGTYAGIVAFRLLTEGRRNKWLEGTFGQYLSPAIIGELKANPDMVQLGGRKREITVLFSDIKGFTSISEKLTSENLVALLNDYLTRQSEQILEREGVIDKFIGDAVMAFFGDPVPVPDHALRACRAAVRCKVALKDSEPIAAKLGVPPLKNRIGINSGPATVGNMGSAERFSYTAMGDTVNLASRLESGNKAFGSSILIGPLTYEQAKDGIVSRPIAKVVVVGKNEPMSVHELLGIAGETDGQVLALVAAYTRAHAALLADDLDAARGHLAEAMKHREGDGPTLWLAHLLDDVAAGKRPRPWDGVYVLDEK